MVILRLRQLRSGVALAGFPQGRSTVLETSLPAASRFFVFRDGDLALSLAGNRSEAVIHRHLAGKEVLS